TTTFGPFGSCFNHAGFFGTSAAAPQVAGAAALLAQANPTWGPAPLQAALEQGALDVGPAGKDNLFGSGMLALGSAPPIPPAPPTAAAPPTLSGAAQEGQTLTATTGAWNGVAPATYRYQWQRCAAAGSPCTDIAGARSAAYTAATADVGATLRVTVTA